jgi:cell division protein ZapB
MIEVMTDTNNSPLHEKIEKLESSVNQLLTHCQKISEENALYKNSNSQLMVERSELQTKNDKVRNKVEAMVDRLKAMDKAS